MKKQKLSLITRSLQPDTKETPIEFIQDNTVDEDLFFIRNHFEYPQVGPSNFTLSIKGAVNTPHVFSMESILNLPVKLIKTLLECSGNKRKFFEPKVFGTQWEKGAISQGYWKGVSLSTLLETTGIKEGAKEVVVEGYDYGKRTDMNGLYTYARSLPIEKALSPDTIVAFEYNEKPIPFEHGFPFRLIVPGWYAMASVKWIKQITVIDSEFKGPFQAVDYVYYPNKENNKGSFPVTTINVNSTIQQPLDMEILYTGKHTIKGIAWTGEGDILKVEISTDEGKTWSLAKVNHNHGYVWSSWSYEWTVIEKGEYTILAKATDTTNRTQPHTAFWNRKGYGYNAIDSIKVKVE